VLLTTIAHLCNIHTYFHSKSWSFKSLLFFLAKNFLENFVNWEPTPLEVAESLEQLRALENDARIKVIITDDESGGIDTLEQANELEEFLQKQS